MPTPMNPMIPCQKWWRGGHAAAFGFAMLLPLTFPASVDGAVGGARAYQPTAAAPEIGGVIVKVRSGFLESSRVGAAGRVGVVDALRVRQWCTPLGVDRVARLWRGSTENRTVAGIHAHPGGRTFVLGLDPGADAVDVANRLTGLPWVEYAEVDRLLILHQVPGDPLFTYQWSLENTGQPYWSIASVPGPNNDTLVEATGTPGADIAFPAAYRHPGPRAQVIVAVIDTGIDTDHEDLRANIAVNSGEIPDNGVDDDRNGFVDDVYGWDFSGDVVTTTIDLRPENDISDSIGHGTHVAGTIAATADNGVGIAGVAADALILGVKMFPNGYFSVSAQAIYYAVARGARVINMSWGGGFPSRALQDALEYAHARGVVLVASSGNSGSETVFYPSGYPQTIAVGSTHADDGLSPFSTYNRLIDVVAPGQQILSLRASGSDLFADIGEPGVHIIADRYLISSGTSMSAPHASGAAAVLLSFAPGLGNERVREILHESAFDIRDPFGEGWDLEGPDKYTGAGRIDLAAAIALLPGVHTVITEPRPWEWVGGDIVISGSANGPDFAGYDVLVAAGHKPNLSQWTTIGSGAAPVSGGILTIWNSTGLAGPYTIRLDAGIDARYDVAVSLVQAPAAEITSPATGDTVVLRKEIMGTAAAPGFESYRLEAVGPLPGATAVPIATSTRPVWEDTLALWRTDALAEGDYDLILTVVTATDTLTRTTTISVSDAFAEGWPVSLPAVAHFAVSTINLDGVGDEEIICPTTRGLWILRSDGTPYPGWPRDTLANLSTAPVVADLDHDGKAEVIVAGRTHMYAYAFIGEQYEGWPQPFSGAAGGIYGGSLPTVGNVDGRGPLEIAAVALDGTLRIWNADGTDYQPADSGRFGTVDNVHSARNSLPAITICDLDRDGRPEVIVAADGISVFDGRTAGPYAGNAATEIASHYSVHGMAVGDFDGDRVRDIAYVHADGIPGSLYFTVDIIDVHGVSLPGWPRELPLTADRYLLYSVAAGDVDGDGVPELFVAPYSLGDGFVYGFHANGMPVGSDSSDGLLARLGGSLSAIGLVDIDLDDQPEIVLRVGQPLFGPDRIVVLEADGSLAAGYPIEFGAGATFMPATPIIGDLNHDGLADMVTVQSTDRNVTVWELGTPIALRARPWPKFRGDSWNSGVVPTPQYDILYLARLIETVVRGGLPFPPYDPADLNCNGAVDLDDVTVLIDYLYRFGPPPCLP